MKIICTRSFPRSLQFSQFADLVLSDCRHVSPEVHVLALLQLHIHLQEQYHSYCAPCAEGVYFIYNRSKASKNT